MEVCFYFFKIKEVKGTEKFKKLGEHAIKFIELMRIACSPDFLNFFIPLRSFLIFIDTNQKLFPLGGKCGVQRSSEFSTESYSSYCHKSHPDNTLTTKSYCSINIYQPSKICLVAHKGPCELLIFCPLSLANNYIILPE